MSATQLPKLPGYSFRDPTKTNYHRAQLFNVRAGHMTESAKGPEEEVSPQVIDQLKNSRTLSQGYRTESRSAKTPPNKAIPRNPPKWLKYDRHVLRFFAYFQEAVHDNPTENFRVRRCVIQHFLDDDTTYVSEPRVENSGLEQGVFIRKHRIPKAEGEFYTWQDFNLGINLNFYGRVFRICDCDDFTRGFYSDQGVQLNSREDFPDDHFNKARVMVNFKKDPEDTPDVREYNEVKLGGGHPNRNLKSFIDNDRRVLSFDVMWEDNSYDGGVKLYKMNYYLSDNTMEIKELKAMNTGCENFPMLLKRMKLPKNPILAPCPALSLRKEEYYQPADIVVGTKVNIYGREILIYDCDEYTKNWYKTQMGIDVQPIPIKRPQSFVPTNPIPPYNGFGSEEDSIGNVMRLRPNPPKPDMFKMFDNDQHVLRFEAKLVSNNPEDDLRKFILSFFPSDDTIKVFEQVERNSGILGGKFLERRKFKNPYTNNYYQDTDCVIGNTLVLNNYRFFLCKADDYSHNYMESQPVKFPQSDCSRILSKIVSKATNRQEFLIQLLVNIDEKLGNLVPYKLFLEALEKQGIQLTYQEEASLLRKWDKGEFKVDMEQVYNELQQA